jgi:cell wall assembly regulator SMI1
MSDLSNEQKAEVILFTHEQKIRDLIANNITELLGPIAKGHAHFDEKILDIVVQIVKG